MVQGSRVQAGRISLTEWKKQKSSSREAGVIGNSGTGFSQNIWLRSIYIVSAKYNQAVYAKGKTQGSQKTDPVGCRLNEI